MFFFQNLQKLSLIITRYALLSRALNLQSYNCLQTTGVNTFMTSHMTSHIELGVPGFSTFWTHNSAFSHFLLKHMFDNTGGEISLNHFSEATLLPSLNICFAGKH